jgi:hypothetical protein
MSSSEKVRPLRSFNHKDIFTPNRFKIAEIPILRKYLTTNLQNYLAEELPIIYQDALDYVQQKTGFSSDFPSECPYSLEQLLDKNWFNCED